jgi:Protease II
MDWSKLINNLLPIKLRESKLLYALIWCLTKWLRDRYDEQEIWKDTLLEELKYTSQLFVFRKLLREKFSSEIDIIDKNNSNISWVKVPLYAVKSEEDITLALECKGSDDDGTNKHVLLSVPESMSVAGTDFVIQVPPEVDKEAVRAFAQRYVFCGIGFDVETLQ